MSKKWPVIWHRILQLKIDFLAAWQTQRVCHFSTSLCEVTDITTSKHNRELAANGHEESPDHWDILPLFEEDGEKKKKKQIPVASTCEATLFSRTKVVMTPIVSIGEHGGVRASRE
jgi:hypothetical protein